jgi:transcriptional regulator with XRE-family HTH domain
MSISAEQSKAARALIGWSRRELAEASQVSERTLIDFERGARAPHRRTLFDLRRALEEAGVIFIDQNEESGPGVRLKNPV